jgi:hypothetical protein
MCFRLEWHTGSLVPPNPPLELTPLRGPEIVLFLSVGFCLTAFLVYRCGATQRQSVGHHVSSQV